MANTKDIRVRFAPSPTGFLHVGSARTALYNFLFTRAQGGKLILRIEDTDRTRHTEEGQNDILESLKWLGITWDEGPEVGGPHGPYIQSQRTEKYKSAVNILLETGKAYRCFCSSERLEKLRNSTGQNAAFKYDKKCRDISLEESRKRAENENFVVRLKIDEKDPLVVNDLIRGKVTFSPDTLDDFVISKGTDQALYHLAVVVDDADMEVTHIIRGEDGLSNTPKHICLQKALNYPTPQYAHLPLLLDENKKKLSKRAGNVSLFVKTLREDEGYLPEALLNGLAMLGWNPKTNQEVFTKEQLAQQFKLENVQKAGAIFSLERLSWLNKQHIKLLDIEKLTKIASEFIKNKVKNADLDLLKRILLIEQGRMSLLKELPELYTNLTTPPQLKKELIPWRESTLEIAKKALDTITINLESFTEWDNKDSLKNLFLKTADDSGLGRAAMLWPVRYVLSGKEKSAGPDELAWVLGKEETLSRIKNGIIALN